MAAAKKAKYVAKITLIYRGISIGVGQPVPKDVPAGVVAEWLEKGQVALVP